jgi:hypothetical protein
VDCLEIYHNGGAHTWFGELMEKKVRYEGSLWDNLASTSPNEIGQSPPKGLNFRIHRCVFVSFQILFLLSSLQFVIRMYLACYCNLSICLFSLLHFINPCFSFATIP